MIRTDETRTALLSEVGKATLRDRYLLEGETPQDLFARVAQAYADDDNHAQRLYEYMSQLWFMPATPILSNGGTDRGLPISCFLNLVEDSLGSISDTYTENLWLAARGGGIGTYWGDVRSIGEPVGRQGTTSGVIPFLKLQDSMTTAISQGSLRRGSAAVYMPLDHPEIEEFIEIRRPTGGDVNRKALNIHHGVCVPDAFMEAVRSDSTWDLKSPKTGKVVKTIKAWDLWVRILTARVETGEPYLLFIDTVNKQIPVHHKELGLEVKQSNLCSEITLPTGADYLGNNRTAVCCLSSLNLEKFDEWSPYLHPFLKDIMKFLDNVLQDFIDRTEGVQGFERARYSAMMERSVGLGLMGFHSFLQRKNIPFEGVVAKAWNTKIFKMLSQELKAINRVLSEERGDCPDATAAGRKARFSNMTSIAPTASISLICGSTSPCIEPWAGNSFTQKTLSGSLPVMNQVLVELLKERVGDQFDEIWSSITTHEGSVQHLGCLSDHEKDVFKTAFEIDQRWVIEHAADRAPFIDQAQSVNLFILPDAEKRDIHYLHFTAWEKGIKSLYYCRSRSKGRAQNVSRNHLAGEMPVPEQIDYNECISCQ